MGVRVLYDRNDRMAALYCSTTGKAFGPIFHDRDITDAIELAENFLQWLEKDARKYSDSELMDEYNRFMGYK